MKVKPVFPTAAHAIAVLLISLPVARGAAIPGTTNRIAHWMEGKSLPHLDATQAEAYAQQHQRRPEALLAAYQTTTDRGFLREAMAKHPRDARVALAAACTAISPQSNPDVSEEKRKWLDALKRSAPDNALAHYLSAREHFKTGQPDVAEKEVLAGVGRPLRDYALDFIEGAQDAYLSAGYTEAEATALAMGSLLMPHLAPLRDVGAELAKRATHYRQSGDAVSANRMLSAAIRIGTQLDRTNSLTILENLVGITIQQNALKELDPTAPFEKSGHTVQAEADRLTKRRAGLRALAGDFNKLFQKMSDKEIGDYFNQQKRLGEEMANRQALAR